jgi:hypothetical protein
MNRPNPKNYIVKFATPTNNLDRHFKIYEINESTYDDSLQIVMKIRFHDSQDYNYMGTQNMSLIAFLRDVRDTLENFGSMKFTKSNPLQKHLELEWVDDIPDEPNKNIPF